MADVYVVTFTGRLTKDPEEKTYGSGDSLTSFSVASTIGFGDNAKTVYTNCVAFKKKAETIAKYFEKGDGITITGTPSQNKKDDKVYHSVIVQDFTFGAKKNKEGKQKQSDDNPFDPEDIQF